MLATCTPDRTTDEILPHTLNADSASIPARIENHLKEYSYNLLKTLDKEVGATEGGRRENILAVLRYVEHPITEARAYTLIARAKKNRNYHPAARWVRAANNRYSVAIFLFLARLHPSASHAEIDLYIEYICGRCRKLLENL